MGEESATNRFRFASEMDRIFESEEFSRSPVMRRLLRFLVNQTLAGNGDHLKAYSVAVDGLGRDADFDAQTDSYPRVQVGRLRRMLDAYYARAGFPNGQRLVIPNGAYRVYLVDDILQAQAKWPMQAPKQAPLGTASGGYTSETPFGLPARSQPARAARRLTEAALILALILAAALALLLAYLVPSTGRPLPLGNQMAYTRSPGMLLLPVEQGVHSPAGLAPSIDQVLGNALHRSWVVDVRSSDGAAPGGRGRPSTSSLPYRLQSVLAGPSGRDLYITLWDRTGQRIWTDHIDLTGREAALEDATRLPVANLIGSFGIIAAQERQHYGTKVAPGYSCLLKNAEFRMSLDPADLEASRNCLNQTFAINRSSPAALAASTAVNYRLSKLNPEEAATLRAKAQAHAKAAMLLNPFSPDAEMASAKVALVQGRCSLGKAMALRAIDLNPYEPENYARTGMLLFQCGDADHEYYLTLARQMNPQLPAFFSLPVIAALGERGQGQEALELAKSLPTANPAQMPYYAITMTLAYAHGGDRAHAARIWRQLAAAPGNAGKSPGQILRALLNSPKLARTIGRSLVRAGIIDRLD